MTAAGTPTPAHLLNDTVEHWRPITAPDGAGGATTSWTRLGDLAARLPQPTARETQVGERHGARHDQNAYLRAGADVQRGDQLRRGVLVLEVLATVTPSIPVYLKAECETQQDGSV